MLKRVGRKRNPPTLLVGMKADAATMKIIRRFLKTLKIELSSELATPLLGIYMDKTVIHKTYVPQSSMQHYSQQPRHGNNLSVHQKMSR